MAPVKRKRPRIGDIIEIPVGRGFAYAHFTHKSEDFGDLLRVWSHVYRERPKDFADLVSQDHQFLVFFPLGAACHRGIVTVVAEEAIPVRSSRWPIFKQSTQLPGFKPRWGFWDGERHWHKSSITRKERSFPELQIVNDTMLVEMIQTKYTAEDEE